MAQKSPIPYVAYCALNIYVLKLVNDAVREPYMDEPFHVPQAQQYCSLDFSTYDPKLTTPPGLYVLSLLLSKLFAMKCTLPLLRFHCTLLSLLLPPLLSHLLPLLKPPPRDEPPRTVMATLSPGWEAIVLGAMPVAWFVGFLYYTDLGAVVCAVAAVVAARRGKSGWAALLGALGCTFRQTNIIWLVYAASLQAFDVLRRPPPSQRGTSTAGTVHLVDPALAIADVPMLLRSLQSLLLTALSRLPELLAALWPYFLPAAGFAGFVAWNGGIALGDRANHVPTPHLVLPLYFAVFATGLAAPLLLTGPLGVVGLAKIVLGKMFGTTRRMVATSLWTVLLLAAIRFFTIVHPFLLSDNRHYTFYIWRRILSPHPLAPYLYAPVYVACFWVWTVRLGNQPVLPLLSLLVCTLLTLVPTPLLEPRYFIIPYLLLRSQLESSALGVAGEVAWYAAINAGTMYVFLEMPFDGGWGEGRGRLMW
ncbi:glycosyltransferase family 59 protein [Calocera viscosa TUFC12733]|uniref:Dol-P-Glc:Glc(2)Man(9)GlcNAc(2)-PP-Dol alpha-1,2-glucosyltransferase n=1 Tax=Calocera viscosa (strain TUFC12733) TaxID=1330018 RepID=A0A167KSL4_CALVF|nr:glycosyltransferase family 59 protein [Calocera viscosa TUFC12733]